MELPTCRSPEQEHEDVCVLQQQVLNAECHQDNLAHHNAMTNSSNASRPYPHHRHHTPIRYFFCFLLAGSL